DFGFSKQLDPSRSFLESRKGTIQYVSPELLKFKQFRISGDVWGIGITMYELLTFKRPFDGRTDNETWNNIISDSVVLPPIPETYSEKLRETVKAMLVKDQNLRIPLNILVKVPGISERVKDLAQKLVGESTGTAKTYLDQLINDVDTKAPDLPPRAAFRFDVPPASRLNIPIDPSKVDFEIKNPLIARRFLGEPSKHLVSLEMMQDKISHTVTIAPEILAGDGIVRIAMQFEDRMNIDRGFRWIGVVDASFELPQKYYPGQDEASVGYCGKDGSLVHNPTCKDDKYIDGNSKFKEGDEVAAEINMTVEREKRTLHFFVKGQQQPISFIGLPDRVKFCVQRKCINQLAKIISLEKVPSPTVVSDIPNAQVIEW
ncbi:MAG: hypothetical protein EZS28_027994, partial [Streblomastix strix]